MNTINLPNLKRKFTGGDGDGTASPNPATVVELDSPTVVELKPSANTTGGGGGSAGFPHETLSVGPNPTSPPTPSLTVLVLEAVETTGIKSNSTHEDGGRVISSHLTSSNLISSHLYYRPRQLLNTIRQI